MNCRQYQENIADYVAGRLAPTEEVRLSAHLADCVACADAEQHERALCARFAASPSVNATADLWTRLAPQLTPSQPRFFWQRFTLPRVWIATPALAAAAAIAVFWFQPLPTGTPPGPYAPGRSAPQNNTNVANNSMTRLVHDVSEIGVPESELLLEETHSIREIGQMVASEGGSL